MERVRIERKRYGRGRHPNSLVHLRPPPRTSSRKGIPNKTTRLLREAIIQAAENIGRDKKGKDGLVGYLEHLAVYHTDRFCDLLGKVLPLQVTGQNGQPIKVEYTMQEAVERLKERGIPIVGVFDGPAEILPPDPPMTRPHNGSRNGKGNGSAE